MRERRYLSLELKFEDLAEMMYRPSRCTRPYRLVVLRKYISKCKAEQVPRASIRAPLRWNDANERCDQENVIRALKKAVNFLRVPPYDLISNWTYMVITTPFPLFDKGRPAREPRVPGSGSRPTGLHPVGHLNLVRRNARIFDERGKLPPRQTGHVRSRKTPRS